MLDLEKALPTQREQLLEVDMKRAMAIVLSAIFVACTGLALGAAPLSAAPTTGAQTYKTDYCEEISPYIYCYNSHGEYSTVTTPNGSMMFQNNLRYDYTVTLDGAIYSSSSGSERYQYLFKKDEQQEHHFQISNTSIIDGQTCTYLANGHFANGQIQFTDKDFNCVP